jgi:hypothetical protein
VALSRRNNQWFELFVWQMSSLQYKYSTSTVALLSSFLVIFVFLLPPGQRLFVSHQFRDARLRNVDHKVSAGGGAFDLSEA